AHPEIEIGGYLPEVALDRLAAVVGVILAPFYRDDLSLLSHGPAQGHGQSPRPGSRLENGHSRRDIGVDEDRADVLGIHHLGAPLHAQDEIGQAGAKGEKFSPRGSLDPGSVLAADDVAVGEHPPVVLELTGRVQLEEVVPALAVDEQAGFARLEAAHETARLEMRTSVCSRSRQNAQTEPVVGCPQRSQVDSSTSPTWPSKAG